MFIFLFQLVTGFGFGWLVSRNPEDVVWKKLGTACFFQAVFLGASLQSSGATFLEQLTLILLLEIPFLWGVTEGVQRGTPTSRKNRP